MLVLHIGPHKTASTYIQHNLDMGRAELAAHGWVYPRAGAPTHRSHHEIARNRAAYLTDGPSWDAFRTAFHDEVKGRNAILSGEGFRAWSAAELAQLAERLGFDHLHVVYAVRDPIDLFYSYWSEEVKQGHTRSLPTRFAQHFIDPMGSHLLNPVVDLGSILAEDRIRLHAIPFDALRARGIDIFSHLLDRVLGLEGIGPKVTRPLNVSFAPALTEFLRVMTLMAAGGAERLETGSDLRLRFIAVTDGRERREIVELVRRNAAGSLRRMVFPRDMETRERIAAATHTALEGCWTIPVRRDEVFDRSKDKAYVYYEDYGLLRSPEIMEVATGMLGRIAEHRDRPEKLKGLGG